MDDKGLLLDVKLTLKVKDKEGNLIETAISGGIIDLDDPEYLKKAHELLTKSIHAAMDELLTE